MAEYREFPLGSHELWSDAEISTANEDMLARGKFCSQVANLISEIPPGSDSTVFGLVGPWGGGKSSILNLISYSIQSETSKGNNGSDIVVAEFSPWATSDGASLMLEFFETLIGAHEGLSTLITREGVAALVKKGLPLFGVVPGVGKAISDTVSGLMGERNWAKEFSKIDDIMGGSKIRVLIVVDDVDRLHGDEILTLIKTIRLLGRFKNVHYLLAYDHDALIDAIKPSLGGDRNRAAAYLEKIVQYPLTIPPAQHTHLRNMVERGIARILEQSRENWLRFSSIYEELLHERLKTVRAVKRFCAQADLYYSLVRGDVNGADFLVMSYLRLFFPGAYNCLPTWKDELTSPDHSDSDFQTWEIRLTSAGLADRDERVHVIKVLRTVFPNEFGAPSEFRPTGASDPDYFDRYFLFGIPEGDVSDAQVIADIRTAIKMKVNRGSSLSFPATFTAGSYRERAAAIHKGYKQFVPQEADVVPLARFLVWLLKELTTRDPGAVDEDLDSWIGYLFSQYPVSGDHETYESTVDILPRLSELDGALRLIDHELSRARIRQIATIGWRDYPLGDELERLSEIKRKFDRALVRVGLNRLISHVKMGEFSEEEHSSNFWFLADPKQPHSFSEALLEWAREDKFRLIDLAAVFLITPEAPGDVSGELDTQRLPQLNLANLFKLIPKDVVAEYQYDEPAGPLRYPVGSWDRAKSEAELALHTWKNGG